MFCDETVTTQQERNVMKETTVNTGKRLSVLGLIACLGALPILGGMTGCATNRYTQSTSELSDDRATSSRVSAALADDTQHRYFEG